MPDLFDLVIEDLRSRDALGYKVHRRPCTPDIHTLAEWLQEAYEECLDKAIYLRGAIEMLKGQNETRPPLSADLRTGPVDGPVSAHSAGNATPQDDPPTDRTHRAAGFWVSGKWGSGPTRR